MGGTLDYAYLSSSDNTFIDSLYEKFQKDPQAVDESWRKFFEGFEFAIGKGLANTDLSASSSTSSGSDLDKNQVDKEFRVYRIIQSYRARGHLISNTNPVRNRKDRKPHLELTDYGLSDADLEKEFICGEYLGLGKTSLRNIVKHLHTLYCGNIGVEYMHITSTDVRRWFRDKFESNAGKIDFPIEKKKRILSKLNESVAFENFLHKKYVGQKRFSLEGGENTIPALDALINKGAELGAKEFVIGMAHRGRLNVLANTLGKTYEYIFNEFEGQATPDLTLGDGDVKYHLGFSSKIEATNGEKVYLKLMPNPSHLEVVAAVVQGYTRSQGDFLYNRDRNKVVPIQIHGDAAVAGQGIVYELIQMSGLEGYGTGGTVHFVINNQIGFTTNFTEARTSLYCTSVGRVVNCPIIHVNGDDAEAVVYASELAIEFRQKFNMDIFVDMVCYRRHGHNEGDEPKYTQPKLYELIGKHSDPREIYKNKLIEGKKIEADLAVTMDEQFKSLLQQRLDIVKQKPLPYQYQKADEEWVNMPKAKESDFDESPETAVDKKTLEKVLKCLTEVPKDFQIIKKAQKVLDDRKQAFEGNKLDWGLVELLAYGTLLLEKQFVRMSGQDVIRGTFSHRHAAVFNANEDWDKFVNLKNLDKNQGKFSIYNSLLSEYAVLGFEYGYSLGDPNGLAIWEAQFGDFHNGAQTIIDQFISSGESKWQRMSGMVMLLPHGYEGQGPEHSNARPERFLQLAAELNMVVGNFTTPANMFHALRRQVKWKFRKPLIVMTPKSLLRHSACVSTIEDLTKSKFQEIIDDSYVTAKSVKRVLMCTGKVYYDLLAKQQEEKRKDVAIVRIEQLYPMVLPQLNAIFKKYKDAEMVWVQEEPKNMGAWTFLLRYKEFMNFHFIGRKSSASPATGYAKVHAKEQAEIVNKAFNLG
ncbi:MAG: 2-oxoglutarate dehydrogenase E1 component [Bacteriovoracaceae bacterium]|nr:2-oxoglutarate dehydrogenase E1 component [Bacteriovoracaceae bacterium]